MSDTKNKTEKKSKKNKTLVLLDAHAILHRAYHALPDFRSTKGEPTGALYGFCTFLMKMIKDLKPDYVAACYDLPEPTKRHEVYTDYKGTRKKIDDDLISQLERSKDVCTAFNIPMYSSPGFEADDMLGTIVEQTKKDPNLDIIIASGDMDTMQLVSGDKVRVYTLKKGIKETIVYNEDGVNERFHFGPTLLPDYKGLRGDPSDNIIGISGIGEKTAEILITNFGTIENIYKALAKGDTAFEKVGIKGKTLEKIKEGKEEALFSKMLATIRRDGPIHFVLPEKEWIASVDQQKVLSFLTEMDFRSLKAKVSEVFSFETTEETVDVSPADLKEIQIMYWVLDSDKTDPSVDDILSFTKTATVSDAKKKLGEMIHDQGVDFIWDDIERPLIPITDEMQRVGIKIDKDMFAMLSKKHHKKLLELEKEIWDIAGVEFNIASPKQLGEVLFEKMGLAGKNQKKTSTGGFSTKESELEKLKDANPIIGLILEYRELAKLLGTYIDTIPTMVDEHDRLHSTFYQNGSATGRMSSQDPNLQNIPNKTDLGREMREAFIAEKGNVLLSFDYSQIELRIAAFLSGDKKLIEIFKKGQDVHSAVAAEVFGVEEEDVTKEMRSRAKTINFGVMYGMGVNALMRNIGTSREEAQEFLEGYFNKFMGLAEYLEDVKREAMQKGYTETFFGRRRYFPELRSKLPFMKAQAERMAINAPIQGTEADIVKLAMVKVDEYVKKEGLEKDVQLLLQVHDELVYEIKESLVKKVAPKIKEIMENIIDPKDTYGVVCVANSSAGDNWLQMKEV
jgi:DNA polymerase-1